MTASTFLISWASTTLAILLVVTLQFPWGPVRRWLARAPELITDPCGREWVVRREGQVTPPQSSKAKALEAGEVTRADRVKAWGRDLNECPWCCGAWLALAAAAAAALEAGEVGLLLWWPVLWFTSSASVVVIDAIADR